MNFQKTQAICKKTQGKWTKNSVLRRINPHSSSTKLLKKKPALNITFLTLTAFQAEVAKFVAYNNFLDCCFSEVPHETSATLSEPGGTEFLRERTKQTLTDFDK